MEAKQTPLIELLERIPQDARLIVEHDQFNSSSHPVGRLCHEAAAALRAALEQQAEPIGWLDGNDKLAEFMHRDLKAEHDKRGSATPREFTVPVYTAPPQRKPLTGEEIKELWVVYRAALPRYLCFARALERAHGIKEGA